MFKPAPAHGESTTPQPPTSDSSTTGIQTTATAFHSEPTATTPASDGFNADAPTTYIPGYY